MLALSPHLDLAQPQPKSRNMTMKIAATEENRFIRFLCLLDAFGEGGDPDAVESMLYGLQHSQGWLLLHYQCE